MENRFAPFGSALPPRRDQTPVLAANSMNPGGEGGIVGGSRFFAGKGAWIRRVEGLEGGDGWLPGSRRRPWTAAACCRLRPCSPAASRTALASCGAITPSLPPWTTGCLTEGGSRLPQSKASGCRLIRLVKSYRRKGGNRWWIKVFRRQGCVDQAGGGGVAAASRSRP
jgi:hypothetical protein